MAQIRVKRRTDSAYSGGVVQTYTLLGGELAVAGDYLTYGK
jgi:hypothetical protein